MESVLTLLVTVLQIALVAFLLWGASLCLPELLGRPRAPRPAAETKDVEFA